MKKSHRVALRPTPEQESRFLQHAGYSRFAYNWAVGEFQAGLQVGEWLSERSLRPRWNLVKGIIAPWGRELSQNSAKYAIIDLGQAASRWGEYRRKRKQGYPLPPGGVSQVQAAQARAGIPGRQRPGYSDGLGQDGHPAQDRTGDHGGASEVQWPSCAPGAARINEVTVNRTAGRWFACFSVETGEPLPPVKDGSTVGVDVGIENLAVCSDRLPFYSSQGPLTLDLVENPTIFFSLLFSASSSPSRRRDSWSMSRYLLRQRDTGADVQRGAGVVGGEDSIGAGGDARAAG